MYVDGKEVPTRLLNTLVRTLESEGTTLLKLQADAAKAETVAKEVCRKARVSRSLYDGLVEAATAALKK